MKKKQQISLEFVGHTNVPQITVAVFNGKVLGDITFTPEPIILGGIQYNFIVHFYPTSEIFFKTDFISSVAELESVFQLHRIHSMNM